MAVSQHIWHCGAGLPGDVLIADLRAYRFEAHFHDAWSIGAIAQGRCVFTVHGRAFEAGEGDLVVIAPGQVHTGGTSAGLLAYRMAYIESAWFKDHALALRDGGLSLPGPVIHDVTLCGQWLAALAPDATDDAQRRGRLSAALFGLLAAHGQPVADGVGEGGGVAGAMVDPGVNQAEGPGMPDVCALLFERMRADPACAPDLDALARAEGKHRSTLVKQFARRYGLPPQAWLRNWRVARARALLRGGLPLADAAAAVGFADQAHLTRVFKQVYGSPPGVLRKSAARAIAS